MLIGLNISNPKYFYLNLEAELFLKLDLWNIKTFPNMTFYLQNMFLANLCIGYLEF